MKMQIFLKRNLKSSYFLISIISVLIIIIFYNYTNLSSVNNLKVAFFNEQETQESKLLEFELLNKDSIFYYEKVHSFEELKNLLNLKKISYGYVFNTSENKFIQYSNNKDIFSGISQEDFYSSYFKVFAKEYTKNLLNLSDIEYEHLYNSEKNKSFKFEYENYNSNSIFPINEIVGIFMFILTLLTCYDFFLLSLKSKIFETINGKSLKLNFLISGILLSSVIFSIPLILSSEFKIANYMLYSVLLFLISDLIVKIFSKKSVLILIPISIIYSLLATLLINTTYRYSIMSLISPCNLYLLSIDSLIFLIIPVIFLFFINICINKSKLNIP